MELALAFALDVGQIDFKAESWHDAVRFFERSPYLKVYFAKGFALSIISPRVHNL
jgi:hypothetical protein